MPYKYLAPKTDGSGNWTNNTKFFAVVVGLDIQPSISGTNGTRIIAVKDAQGNIVDSFAIDAQSAVGFFEEGMFRRMLVPPNGLINLGAATFIQVAIAAFEDREKDENRSFGKALEKL